MSNNALPLAQEFLNRLAGGAEPAAIAALFSENLEWEIAGDTGALPWIGKKSGRAAIVDFVRDSRAVIERITFDVHDILAGDERAVILGSLASRLRRTGRIIKTDFAIVLSLAHGEIVRFQMLEDSFAVSQAARCDLDFSE
jgi:ketosteroid isomerase-like protein